MYDKHPHIVAGTAEQCFTGWSAVAKAISEDTSPGTLICLECYPGVFVDKIEQALTSNFPASSIVRTEPLMREPSDINGELNTLLSDDPVFGVMLNISLDRYFDRRKLAHARECLAESRNRLTFIVGVGASLIAEDFDLLIYADMPRWEIQLRQRRNEVGNLGADNAHERAALKYKRAFFADWRAADRLKTKLYERIDWLIDTTAPHTPKAIRGDIYRKALVQTTKQPFRVVPFFDPGPWGGHWMERVCDLPRDGAPNHAWCFDCVPEENSLLLSFGEERVEIPALNLVLAHPQELLGTDVHVHFGAEFPIRFDFLDTMGGGNLSLQVHPLTSYIYEHFGMQYTQDESYYLLDAEPNACVYLGLKENVAPEEMIRDLERAQSDGFDFPADRYVNRIPAQKHDHFLIPAGTVHCSGKNSMVLEISATPYIFTFKLWDWGRLGLDSRPRPIHLQHGFANIQWDRTTRWVMQNLVNRTELISEGEGWRAERTGLHSSEFIETVRHWFSVPVEHNTQDTVHVLNLVEGQEAIVESPTNAFAPFVVHYAETFIVPAVIGSYTVRPHGVSAGKQCATMQASVRPQSH